MTAEKIGRDTMLARIVQLVSQAQRSRAPIQRLADQVSGWFVPAVIAVAVVAFSAWAIWGPEPRLSYGVVAAIAVLIIACPCALGLATPTALLVGTGRGAQLGILVKGPEILESTRRVDTIVLDKTGTVTTGQMSVVALQPVEGTTDHDLLRTAAAVERASEHPIAKAVVRAAEAAGFQPDVASNFSAQAGVGATGTVDGRLVTVGRADPSDIPAHNEGRTVISVRADGRLLGVIAIADTVKPTSAAAIERFRRLGLRPMLVTGDNEATGVAVATLVGIPSVDVIAGVLPDEKVDVVRRLQLEGRIVAMEIGRAHV